MKLVPQSSHGKTQGMGNITVLILMAAYQVAPVVMVHNLVASPLVAADLVLEVFCLQVLQIFLNYPEYSSFQIESSMPFKTEFKQQR
jgi:hypothetical protein